MINIKQMLIKNKSTTNNSVKNQHDRLMFWMESEIVEYNFQR